MCIAMTLSSSSPKAKPLLHQNPRSSGAACNHTPSATLDLLILLLVLFSVAFLLASSLSHILRSLSPLLPSPLFALAGALALLLLLLAGRILRRSRRRCGKPRCRALERAAEFDVRLQVGGGGGGSDPAWREIEGLPWKGGLQGNNPDYECLRAELRRMAPPDGRAVLLFRARCGCSVAKLEAWGPKRVRRQKKWLQKTPKLE